MAMPIFTDEQPDVEVRGGMFVFTHTFNEQEIQLVMTRYAALRSAMLVLQKLDEPAQDAWVHKLEAAK